jgi:hypothetical protein
MRRKDLSHAAVMVHMRPDLGTVGPVVVGRQATLVWVIVTPERVPTRRSSSVEIELVAGGQGTTRFPTHRKSTDIRRQRGTCGEFVE